MVATDQKPASALRMIRREWLRTAIIGIGAFHGFWALAGGSGLLTSVVPRSLLAGWPFTRFVWPGVILLLVIGGARPLAVITAWRRIRHSLLRSAVAGFALVIRIVVELAMMAEFWFLHGIFFATGPVQLILVYGRLNILPEAIHPTSATDAMRDRRPPPGGRSSQRTNAHRKAVPDGVHIAARLAAGNPVRPRPQTSAGSRRG